VSAPVFEVDGIRIVRGGRALLDDVSFAIGAGELVVVVGENGAGKSTLLRALAGDLAPDAGRVLFDGRPLSSLSALAQARHRAVVPQDTSIAFPFTAFDVVLLGRSPHSRGRPGASDRAVVRRALDRVDAAMLAERRFSTLSGGERARVVLARAFAQILESDVEGPRALLLDEPAAALDIAHQRSAFDAIRVLARDDRHALVAVLHDLNLAAAYADRVVLLKAGRVLTSGTVADAFTEPALAACFSIPVRRFDVDGRGAPLFAADASGPLPFLERR
jgi:iron complex transport system ATP-binding protein